MTNVGPHISQLSIGTQVAITSSSHMPIEKSSTSPNDLMDFVFQADSEFNTTSISEMITPYLLPSSNTNKLNQAEIRNQSR